MSVALDVHVHLVVVVHPARLLELLLHFAFGLAVLADLFELFEVALLEDDLLVAFLFSQVGNGSVLIVR